MITGNNLDEIRDAARKEGNHGYLSPEAVDILVKYTSGPVNWAAFTESDQPFILAFGYPVYVRSHGYWMEEPKSRPSTKNPVNIRHR